MPSFLKFPLYISYSKFSLFLILYYQFGIVSPGSEVGKQIDSFSMDTKIYVEAGATDCYYQYVYANYVMYLEYKVLRGGDQLIGMSIRDPNGNYVLQPEWKDGGSYHTDNAELSGYYAFCLDNQLAKFSAKLVGVYLSTYNANDWERFSDELEQLELSVGNSTQSLIEVDSRITQMLKYLFVSRSLESRDYLLLQNINFYVSFFSGLQCAIIIIAGFIHVTILKSLFNDNTQSHAKMKIRLWKEFAVKFIM